MSQGRPEETHPGEKGPPAWEERSKDGGTPMADEPPDSSSEVDQLTGPPTVPSPDDTDDDEGDRDAPADRPSDG